MGPELDEITWSGEVGGFCLFIFFNKEAQHGDKGAEIYGGCLGAEKSM